MTNAEIADPLFLEAVEAVDAGNLVLLQYLLAQHPELSGKRLVYPEHGYFANPYLLWFVADNPIRNHKLPVNIAEVAQLLITAIKQMAPQTLQEQLDYTLVLVATGRVPKEMGVQIKLMNTLLAAGAVPGNAHGALAHNNIDAARYLVKNGGIKTLATAICLDEAADTDYLLTKAGAADVELALVAASFYGKTDAVQLLIKHGVNINALPPNSGFHSHATALHQAVSSGSLETVKTLVAAGADLAARDRIYNGTPLGWSMYMQTETNDEMLNRKYAAIEEFLRNCGDA